MSYNGSGTFVINSTGQPVVTGTVISSSTFNAFTADIGTGLSTAITKNGQTTTTALIPFAFGISAAVSSSFAAGTVAAPSIYLATDTGTGFYRIGANNNGYSVSGTKLLDFSSALLAITGAATVSTTLGVTGATTLSSALTYGGVTLSNAVTGTGNMVLSASPTLTGTVSGATINASVGFNGVLGGSTPAAASVTTLTASGIVTLQSSTNPNSRNLATKNLIYNEGTAGNAGIEFKNLTSGNLQYLTIESGDVMTFGAQAGQKFNYSGVTKLETTSAGAAITGTLGVTGVTTIGGNAATNNIAIINATQGATMQWQEAGTAKLYVTAGAGFNAFSLGDIGMGSTGSLKLAGSNAIAVTIANGTSTGMRFNGYGAGALTTDASGNITATSDESIKTEIRPFIAGIAELALINPILHGYTKESGLDTKRNDYAGFSAQNVLAAIPQAVGKSSDGRLSLNDRPILAAAVNALKSHEFAVVKLVAEVQSLRSRVALLERN